jgi:hypothetical protein
VKKWKLEIYLHNGMRVVITENSNKKSIQMFEEASKVIHRKGRA